MHPSRTLLVGLCIVATLVFVSGAGHNPNFKKYPFQGPSKRFPTKAQIEASPELTAKYTGDNKIIVHVVPHTHDDVGWLKTVDQYYLGANNSIQHAAVRHILDTVVEELGKNPARKFIYVEQAFFQMWWERQTPDIQEQVRKFVANGQFEFINGGWCMHDEAGTHWIDMLDQTTLGHQFILKEFGVQPKVQWQIDPFGHSSTQAAILSAGAGFEALFFGRIDHQDHAARMAAKNMEFIWRGSPSLGQNAQVFTGAFQNGNYGPPEGFCFDWFCGDEPIITDKRFIDYNVPNRVQAFLDEINYQASFTKGVNLMITMGSDFQYESAREWFENLDMLLEAVNADGRITAFYSTPSIYVAAKNAEQGLSWTVKTDDFFPYADGDHAYWTGYFTSRPSLKRYVRTSSALLQASKQLEAISGGDGSASLPFEMAVAILQHHDAVAGTAKQHVAFDYAQRLHIAQTTAQNMMAAALANATTDGQSGPMPQFAFCELANISICSATTDSQTPFQVLLYNPLARTRTELITFPIWGPNVVVADDTGAPVQAQVLNVFNVSSHWPSSSQLSLNFIAQVPAMGFRSYFVSPASSASQVYYQDEHFGATRKNRHAAEKGATTFVSANVPVGPNTKDASDITIQNSFVSLTISGTTGQVTSLTDKVSGYSTGFDISYGFYNSYQKDNDQNSGAYIFRPAQQRLNRISVVPQLILQTGPIVNQVTQLFNEFLNHTIRIVDGQPGVAVEYTVGEIPIEDQQGKEVVIQYATTLASKATWFSDSNGREMQPRIRDYRFSWNYNVTEPYSGNYVPMDAAAYLTDGRNTFTVLNDRAQGVVSMQDGTLEIMVHRRTLMDDARGVGEPINETQWMSPYPNPVRSGPGLIITGTHYFFLANATGAASTWRPMMQRVYAPVVQVYAPLGSQSISEYIGTHAVHETYINKELPVNVDLTTVQTWAPWTKNPSTESTIMIRLAHMFAVGEDPILSGPVNVDLASLFRQAPTSVTAMSLTVNKPLADSVLKMKWNLEGENQDENLVYLKDSTLAGTVVTLSAMQIQAFLLTFSE